MKARTYLHNREVTRKVAVNVQEVATTLNETISANRNVKRA